MGEVVAGRFELIDVLDAGGSGTVWRAWDHRQLRYRAVKVLRHSDSDSVIRFVQESKRMIEHPHVISPRNWYGEDDRVLFTMDLVRGGSVANLMGDFGVLPEGWMIELAHQATQALIAVHTAGYVHRDVKPSNLLLGATGRGVPHLRLADFGTAAKLGGPRRTVTTAVLGTPGYLSPEARHGADPTPTQDIFALGVVMHQMASGGGPDDLGDVAPRVGPELAGLIRRMTADDPRDRPSSANEVADELRRLPGAGDLAYGADEQDPVEIFDHLPALPLGWGEQGPEIARPAGPGDVVAAVAQPSGSTPWATILLALVGVVLVIVAFAIA